MGALSVNADLTLGSTGVLDIDMAGPLAGQFDQVDHQRGESGALLVDGALAHIECRTEAVHRAGDHDILVGRVTAMAVNERAGAPLLYYGSTFRALTER